MREVGEIKYRELDLRTNRLANALLDRGLVPCDRVGAWMEDRLESAAPRPAQLTISGASAASSDNELTGPRSIRPPAAAKRSVR